LEGALTIIPSADPSVSVRAEGYVEYVVTGQKPGILSAAPDFIIDRTIEFIKVRKEL
jgi:hypothetical protein